MTTSSGGGTTATSSSQPVSSSNTEVDLSDDGGPGNANHNHALVRGDKIALTDGKGGITGYRVFAPSGKHTHGEHSHQVTIPVHTHNVNAHSHSLRLQAHSHNVRIPGHIHSVTIPSHAHEITPGIFFSGCPTSFGLYVNGMRKANFAATDAEIDLTSYLVDSSTNLIPRGSWLSVEVRPNDLAYVSIDMYVQGFVQSRGDQTV